MSVGANRKMVFRLLILFFLVIPNAFAENICVDNVVAQESIERFFSTNGFDVAKKTSRQYKIYFDTPEFLLLNSGYSLRFLATEYRSKKLKQKFYEHVELFSGQNQNDIFSVKHYKNVESLEEKHPLLFLVKRKDREQFIGKIKGLGVKYPMRLKEAFQASDIIHKVSLSFAGIPIGFVAVHGLIVTSQDQKISINLRELKLDYELVNQLATDKKDFILGYARKFECGKNSEYEILFSIVNSEIDNFKFKLAHPYFFNLFYTFILTLIGVLVLKGLFWKRLRWF